MGMYTVRDLDIEVPRAELLTALISNRARHVETYALAVVKYKEVCIQQLNERLTVIKNDDCEMDIRKMLQFEDPAPVSYEGAYKMLIDMLEMSTQENIEITGQQFAAWVQDKWDWTDAFNSFTVSYANMSNASI